MGLITSDLYVYHGTRTAYDRVLLPGDAGFVSEVGQMSGAGFYTFATTDPSEIEIIRDNARVYAQDGMVLSGRLTAGTFQAIDGSAPIGEELASKFRQHLSGMNTGDPHVDAYYHHLASTLNPEMNGATLWGNIAGDAAIKSWIVEESTHRLGDIGATLNTDKKRLNAAIKTHAGLEDGFAGLDEYNPEQRSVIGHALRELHPAGSEYHAYYDHLAERVEDGKIKPSKLFQEFRSPNSVSYHTRQHALDHIELPPLEHFDAHWGKIISNMGIAGVYYRNSGAGTMVFQGDVGVRQLPALNVEELHGRPPRDLRSNPSSPIEVGTTVLEQGGGRGVTSPSNESQLRAAPESLTRTTSITTDITAGQLMPLADIRHGSYTSDAAIMYHPEEMARIAKRIGLDVPVADMHSLSIRSEGGQLHLDVEFKSPEAQRAAVANGLGDRMQRATETLVREAKQPPERIDVLRAQERAARERALAPGPGEHVDPRDFGRMGVDGVSETASPAASTPDAAPRVALAAEPTGWLERDLTVREALAEHTQTWFGQGASPDPLHDPAHVILALAGAHPYQGTYEAEMHAIVIEQGLSPGYMWNPRDISTQQVYVDRVRRYADGLTGLENKNRTLLWAMGAQTGQTSHDIYRGLHHDNQQLINTAQEMGIASSSTNEIHNEWTVTLPDGTTYAFSHENPEKTVLPTGSNGVETFTRFDVPTEEKIIPVFERVQPVLQDLQPQIDAVYNGSDQGPTRLEMTGDIKVRDIEARMSGTGAPLKIRSRVSASQRAEDKAEQPAINNAEP